MSVTDRSQTGRHGTQPSLAMEGIRNAGRGHACTTPAWTRSLGTANLSAVISCSSRRENQVLVMLPMLIMLSFCLCYQPSDQTNRLLYECLACIGNADEIVITIHAMIRVDRHNLFLSQFVLSTGSN